MNRNILALDTSGDCCSVAILPPSSLRGAHEVNDAAIYIERSIVAPREHTKFIMQMINEVLDEAEIRIADLACIVFSHGPGSFTGIRLAASIVQGLAFPHDIPVMGISTLRAIAQELFETESHVNVLVVLDARMGEIYLGKYAAKDGIMQPLIPDAIIKPDGKMVEMFSEGFVVAGSGYEFNNLPCAQARYVARLAHYDMVVSGLKAGEAEKALPVYLRNEIVTLQ